MGPILICDKSALHGIGQNALNMLRRYFLLNVPPVLVLEILGDLKKFPDDATLGQSEVQKLANKLVAPAYAVGLNFRKLIDGEFTGKPVTKHAQIPVAANAALSDKGRAGSVISTSEEEAIFRWQEGKFTEAEELLSSRWRQATTSIDLEGLKKKLRSQLPTKLKVKTATDVFTLVDDLMAYADFLPLLQWFLHDAGIHIDAKKLERIARNEASAKALLPYTFHCLRVSLAFHISLICDVIGTKATNRVDMEYLYYVPFCHAFSSDDKFHKTITQSVLRPNQFFVERDVLKKDLNGLSDWWDSLEDGEKAEELRKTGPPENPDSIIHKIWTQAMKPGYRHILTLSELPTEANAPKLMKMIKDALAATKQPATPNSEAEFIVRQVSVRLDRPCPCGSASTFRDCCGKKLA